MCIETATVSGFTLAIRHGEEGVVSQVIEKRMKISKGLTMRKSIDQALESVGSLGRCEGGGSIDAANRKVHHTEDEGEHVASLQLHPTRDSKHCDV